LAFRPDPIPYRPFSDDWERDLDEALHDIDDRASYPPGTALIKPRSSYRRQLVPNEGMVVVDAQSKPPTAKPGNARVSLVKPLPDLLPAKPPPPHKPADKPPKLKAEAPTPPKQKKQPKPAKSEAAEGISVTDTSDQDRVLPNVINEVVADQFGEKGDSNGFETSDRLVEDDNDTQPPVPNDRNQNEDKQSEEANGETDTLTFAVAEGQPKALVDGVLSGENGKPTAETLEGFDAVIQSTITDPFNV
jgi:hypothetical protein